MTASAGRLALWSAAAVGLALAAGARAEVTRIEILERAAFADGRVYGNAGAYQRIRGRFHGELDPRAAANAAIPDLDRAPADARGRVAYSADFDILAPRDLARGNHTLLYEAPNRGSRLALALFDDAAQSDDPRSVADAGNGFLLRHGFILAWSGWEPNLRDDPHLLRIDVPRAIGVAGLVRDEFLFNAPGRDSARLSFASGDVEGRRSTLSLLENHRTPPRPLAPTEWAYVDAQRIRLLPQGRAFSVGAIHQFTYPAADPPVGGIGFAATRDFVAFLRRSGDADSPLAVGGRPVVDVALAHGNSQSGRYLRSFLHLGFNADEAGRPVFDGLSVHLASARIELDRRFAQPARASSTGYGFRGYGEASFPFAYDAQRDPLTGRIDGLLVACTRSHTCPRILHTASSSEYWQSAQSLVATDPAGARDAVLPSLVRVYHFSGSQHSSDATMPEGTCARPANLEVDPRPAMRALLVALVRWIRDGTSPPASAYPRIADGSLVPFERLRFPRIPGVLLPPGPNPRERFDPDPTDAMPRVLEGRYPVLVPAVDRDGNEVGGLRMPELAAPAGTATGWSVRAREAGGAGELCYLDGMFLPFAATRAERRASGDPRLSLAERYHGRADRAVRVRDAAERLARQGYLLDEDVERVVARAAMR